MPNWVISNRAANREAGKYTSFIIISIITFTAREAPASFGPGNIMVCGLMPTENNIY